MLIADLFCGEGGAAVGYRRAFPHATVVGVDIVDRPRYPYEFVQADAMTFDLTGFDFVHASPPCQMFSTTRVFQTRRKVDLLRPTLRRLEQLDVPWVVENVPGAPMPEAVTLCGAALDCTAVDEDGTKLVLKRHRLFCSNQRLVGTRCKCNEMHEAGFRVAGVYGAGAENRANTGGGFRGGYVPSRDVCAQLIGGCEYMTKWGLSQAIPPSYTEFIGRQLCVN